MCKDHFEGLLKIDLLKQVDSSLLSDTLSKSLSYDVCNNTSSQGTATSTSKMQEDGSSPAQGSSTGEIVSDETAILKVMVSPQYLFTSFIIYISAHNDYLAKVMVNPQRVCLLFV